MSKPVTTAADRLMAERIAKALVPKAYESDVDISALAAILAEYREVTISCALVAAERRFFLWEKKPL